MLTLIFISSLFTVYLLNKILGNFGVRYLELSGIDFCFCVIMQGCGFEKCNCMRKKGENKSQIICMADIKRQKEYL